MKKLIILVFISVLIHVSIHAQQNIKERLSSFNKWSLNQADKAIGNNNIKTSKGEYPVLKSGVFSLLKNEIKTPRFSKTPLNPDSLSLNDTLIIGAFPGDSIVISGNYFHNGPIVILNDGYLGFKNTTATILGDVYVTGQNARLVIDSSYLFFPQLFFYQRTLLAALKSTVTIRHSTLDYSGLSHNLVATDSAILTMEDITYSGFTTNGIYKQAEISMNGCNQAGEYIISDSVKLSFNNVNTLLLWHKVPFQSSLHIEFPDGSFVSQYHFQPNQPGVVNLNYTIDVYNSTEVWWALMPTGGSDVVVQNSEIRAVGLWFLGNDTITVNGLVDNSSYVNFTAGLSDRNLQLINSSVMTWSLYPMEESHVKVQICILGEIGTMGRAFCENISVFADGSGGYVWATDTTFLIVGFSSLTSAVRSDRSGILLLAYDAVNGQVQAQGNSVLMVLQSTLSEPPVMYDKSCIWTAQIDGLSQPYAGLTIPVIGTSSINKTTTSNLMDFYAYHLFFQKAGDTSWTTIGPKQFIEKEKDTLALWNTSGLQPGTYNLRLVLYDDTPDTNSVDVVRSVNLLPLFMGVTDKPSSSTVRLFPNPASDNLFISFNHNDFQNLRMRIFSNNGQFIREENLTSSSFIDISEMQSGVYYVEFPDTSLSHQLFIKK